MSTQPRATRSGDIWAPGDPWPVNWSGVWVGALAALAAALIFGLAAAALGWHLVGPAQQVDNWKTVNIALVACSVASAFFAFVIGGWVATRVAGVRYSEPGMLHGAVTWLLAIPILLAVTTLGGGAYLGSWYNGLAGRPTWAAAAPTSPAAAAENMTEEERLAAEDRAARVARNTALMAVTVLLLGLMGSVLGGWMGSGEPMSLSYLRDHSRAGEVQITVRDTGPPVEQRAGS